MAKVLFEGRKELDYRVNEAYKSLRTNVQFSGTDVQVIDFTSCTPNEGKSSVSFNLAVSFADSGKRVVMIDADMRKSVLAGRYKVGGVEAGLAHYLSGQKTLDEVCLKTDIEGMDIIFSGPFVPNPAELLESQNFHDLVQYCREHYDYVLIDLPPVLPVADALVLGTVVDGVVLVIESGEVKVDLARDVKKQLQHAGANILGVVLNKVRSEHLGYGYGYYYYYGSKEASNGEGK